MVIGLGIPLVHFAGLYDLYAEGLQPGEQTLQGRLILQRAMHDHLDRLD